MSTDEVVAETAFGEPAHFSSNPRGFDDRDRIFAALRVVAFAAVLTFALWSLPEGEMRIHVTLASVAFALYTGGLYGLGWPLSRLFEKSQFYLTVAIIDLAFCIGLMSMTGGAASPFYRALYVWIAMLAFHFGRKTGLRASLIALVVFLLFHLASAFQGDLWVFCVQAGGMLMHGPLIGALTDRERKRAFELRLARDSLAETNARLVEAQSQRIQQEKLSSLGLLAAGVAHEINNPLSGVIGCVKALRGEQVPIDRREVYFDTVDEGLERIRQTVRGLLDYARQRPTNPGPVDVHEVATAAARLVQPALRARQLVCEVEAEPGDFRAHADRAQVMQVLVNLLLNACDASPVGSRVLIDCARGSPGFIDIAVRDQGLGIAPEILDRVCDPFFTTKPEGQGTGLGLSVSLGIVRGHGGTLSFADTLGGGATVVVRLPEASDA
jgi:signal transduction histidine kinase